MPQGCLHAVAKDPEEDHVAEQMHDATVNEHRIHDGYVGFGCYPVAVCQEVARRDLPICTTRIVLTLQPQFSLLE